MANLQGVLGLRVLGALGARLAMAAVLLPLAPVLTLPSVDLPRVLGGGLAVGPAAVAVGWLLFLLVGGWLWSGAYLALARRQAPLAAAVLTALCGWLLCSLVILPTAPWWSADLRAGGQVAPGWFGLGFGPGAPLTLAFGYLAQVPGLLLMGRGAGRSH